jgi:glycosyltransferase involved in cell wall biosynthesis
VFPSYREGFPNVVMQAGAMGLPSIVSDINGCNEIIENNINGLVIKVKSIHSIYDAIIKITSNKSLFNILRLNSRDSIKIKYEREVFWSLLLKEYENLIKKIIL